MKCVGNLVSDFRYIYNNLLSFHVSISQKNCLQVVNTVNTIFCCVLEFPSTKYLSVWGVVCINIFTFFCICVVVFVIAREFWERVVVVR